MDQLVSDRNSASPLEERSGGHHEDVLPFVVTGINVAIEEGFKIKWQGREIDSGRLTITRREPGGSGVIDYKEGKVSVDFMVRIALSELFDVLDDMGVDQEVTKPVDAVIHSEGVVFDDHCFRLAGKAQLAEHRIFSPETKVDILAPTRCRPDSEMSGIEIRDALRAGRSVSWNFNPTERRVVLVLPDELGGATYNLCLAGSYTFTGVVS